MLAVVPVVTPPPASANHTIALTVRITRMADLGGDLDDNQADLYVAVIIEGHTFDSFDRIVDDQDTVTPTNLSFTRSVSIVNAPIKVILQVWDNDSCDVPFCENQLIPAENDDQGDVDPKGGDRQVDLLVDPVSGQWSGDTSTGTTCLNGGLASDSAEVCWQISTNAPDADGDGLLDDWEINGLDLNDDGTPEVNLPAMGANPNVPDIFLELDYSVGQSPNRDDIRAMKHAFAAAGISLWVDLGGLVDPAAREGQLEGTCNDGIDNSGDGQADGADTDCDNVLAAGVTSGEYLETSIEDSPGGNCADGIDNDGVNGADGNDPSCLVGDFLGGSANWGGNAVPILGNCGLDTTFYTTKNGTGSTLGNFNPNRRAIFHYAISTQGDQDTDGAGPDTGCTIGGQGEIGGNDYIEYNHDGGTIMHELGHNLKLGHGGEGTDGSNCDPNHVSGMNYDLQFGIPRVGGGVILDYSPPRITLNGSTRGRAPLDNLTENTLDETVALDPTDGSNRFIFVDSLGQKITNTLNALPNWNGDTISDGNPATPDPPDFTDKGVTSNLNDAGPAPAGGGPRSPRACINALTNETLDGNDDWKTLVLPFMQYGDSLTQKVNGEDDNVPTIEDRNRMTAAIHTTDLSVAMIDSADPVGAGEQFSYTVLAGNQGPNPATSVALTVTLPGEVSFVSSSLTCPRAGSQLTCTLGEMLPGASRQLVVTVSVPADLVYANGGPKTITGTASIDDLAGPDANSANDSDTEDTLVITKADVKVTTDATTSPLEVLIGQPAGATLDVTVENGGPSSPVDTTLSGSVVASSGLTVTPATTTASQTALSIGSPRTVTQSFTLACTSPGIKTAAFTYTVVLVDPTAVDPDSSNNSKSASFQIDCVVPIAINVRPGGFPNSINLNTDATLAALTTNAGEYGLPLAFDATRIDPLSVRWGLRSKVFNIGTVTGAREIHGKGHLERSYELDERTRDADLDMVLHFKPSDSGLVVGSTEACLKGSFLAGDGNTYRFLGCDAVVIRP